MSLKEDTFDPRLYDRDNGAGAAERVINELRSTGDVNPETSELAHMEQRRIAAGLAQDAMNQPSGKIGESEGYATFRLGLDDVAGKLGPMVDKFAND